MEVDTGPWLRLVQYERTAWAAGNAHSTRNQTTNNSNSIIFVTFALAKHPTNKLTA
jgi:N-acetyl-anhydromuramyl-L-alanine amidase AmpD